MEYLLYFALTLLFSTLFSMGGVGSAVALVSIFPMAGLSVNLAKATALFINGMSTISASVMNLSRGALNIRFALPLVISILITTPIGAYLSQFVAEYWGRWVLIYFLLISGSLLFKPQKTARLVYDKSWPLYLIGVSVGIISGLLGVGGGALIIPLLILLGYEPKKAAYAVSFVIPFSSFAAFFTYLNYVDMDWTLLLVVTLAAVMGGFIGNKIMHYKLSQPQVKKLIASILYLLAIKMIWTQFA